MTHFDTASFALVMRTDIAEKCCLALQKWTIVSQTKAMNFNRDGRVETPGEKKTP